MAKYYDSVYFLTNWADISNSRETIRSIHTFVSVLSTVYYLAVSVLFDTEFDSRQKQFVYFVPLLLLSNINTFFVSLLNSVYKTNILCWKQQRNNLWIENNLSEKLYINCVKIQVTIFIVQSVHIGVAVSGTWTDTNSVNIWHTHQMSSHSALSAQFVTFKMSKYCRYCGMFQLFYILSVLNKNGECSRCEFSSQPLGCTAVFYLNLNTYIYWSDLKRFMVYSRNEWGKQRAWHICDFRLTDENHFFVWCARGRSLVQLLFSRSN